MIPLNTDLSIWKKFAFEFTPVGVKYLYSRPEGIEKIDRPLAMCEWIKETHKREDPFYVTKGDEDCVGEFLLGISDMPPYAESGQIGVKLEIFQDARANARIYEGLPKFAKGTVNYVVFSPLKKLTFDPDILLVMAEPSQAEIVLRAMTYSTGEKYEPKSSAVIACAYLFVYPYKTGKVNFIVTGMSFGMKAREVFPPGKILISIPYNWIPTITHNLQEMKWVLPSYTMGRDNYVAFFPHEEF